MAQIELSSLVGLTQSYIAKNYATALIDKSKTAELKAYIGKYLYLLIRLQLRHNWSRQESQGLRPCIQRKDQTALHLSFGLQTDSSGI